MDLLTAVNNILPWMEENKVTTIDTKHPTVALILDKIDLNLEKILNEGYWFNTEKKKFFVSPEGTVARPTNLISLYPTNKALNYEARGDKIYDLDNSTFQIQEPFEAMVRTQLAFEEVPESAARTIMWRAGIDAYVPDFGVANSVQIMMAREAEAYALLQREHLRKKHFSAMNSAPGFRFMNSLRG